MKKLLFSLIFCMVLFSVALSSASDFDNIQTYSPETRTYKIDNLFGLGETLAEIKLNTPLNVIVPRGYQKVAEFELYNFKKDYVGAFKDMNFYQANDISKEINRTFDYKYLSSEWEEQKVYDYICTTKTNVINGTEYEDCRQEQVNTKNVLVPVWIKFSDVNELPNDASVTIGIFTDVQKGDSVEWIPTFFGERLTEWAEWTESLNADIISYYNFEQNNTALIDQTGYNNASSLTAITSTTGILGNGFSFDGSTSCVLLSDNEVKPTHFTYSMWWKSAGSGEGSDVKIKNVPSGVGWTWENWGVAINEAGGWNLLLSGNPPIPVGSWTHIAVTNNGTKGVLYVNGTQHTIGDFGDTIYGAGNAFGLGADDGCANSANGVMDEVGIWSRALSSTEIEELYNSGDGLAYPLVDTTPPTISIISPTNITYPTSTIWFNATADEEVDIWIVNYNGTNVTLSGINESLEVADGSYQLLLYTNDTSGNWGLNDSIYFSVDTTPPTFTTIPDNATLEFNNAFGVTFIGEDETEFDSYFINWTDTFEINSTGYLTNSTILPIGIYEINVSINDTAGNINSTIYKATITQNTGACDVLFNESSPISYPATFEVYSNCNSDFVLYRNGTEILNNSVQTLGVGSWNFTAERNDTANYSNIADTEIFIVEDTTPPKISVISPTNITYPISTIWFNATADEEVDIWIVNYNGTNVTLSDINSSLEVADGSYQLLLYTNDTSGNWGLNDSIYFSVNTTPPTSPNVYSPTSQVYSGIISINYTASESSWGMSYYNISLMFNDIFNKTIIGNNSLNLGYSWDSTEIPYENYTIRVEAVDNSGLKSYSDSEEFKIFAENFVSTWKTDNAGTSNNTQITLPLEATGTYNFMVYWGDGKSDYITAYDDAEVTHNYDLAGTYEVTISGVVQGFRFNDGGDKLKLLEISNWDNLNLGNFGGYFFGCENLQIASTDILNLAGTTNMESAFGYTDVSTIPNIKDWDVSSVTNMGYMFAQTPFDQNLSEWDVSGVTSMEGMFEGVTLSQENYDSLLDGWASLPTLQSNVIFNAGDSVYCEGEDSRNNTLIGIYNWTIIDGGINESCVYHEEVEEIPSQYIQGEGQIYNVMNTAGAGLGKFMIYMGNSLPILIIILVMVGIIVAVGYSIAKVISGSIGGKKQWHTK